MGFSSRQDLPPWKTEIQTMVWVFPSQKLRPWSEFLLSLVNTESGVELMVWVLLGPWSQKRWGRGRPMGVDFFQKEKKGGGKLGKGKTYHKTPPQKRIWTPPTYDAFPPRPLCSRPVIILRGNGHKLSEPSKTGFGWRTLIESMVRFPPPKIARDVLPPFAVSQFLQRGRTQTNRANAEFGPSEEMDPKHTERRPNASNADKRRTYEKSKNLDNPYPLN